MDQNGRYHYERHNRPDHCNESVVFGILGRQDGQRNRLPVFEFGSCQDGDEDGTDTNGTKVACEKRLSPGLYVWYERLECHHDGNASEENDKYRQDHQSPHRQGQLRAVELLPWNDGAKVDEVGQVDEKINDV